MNIPNHVKLFQSDPFKLETGGMVDMKEFKKKYNLFLYV